MTKSGTWFHRYIPNSASSYGIFLFVPHARHELNVVDALFFLPSIPLHTRAEERQNPSITPFRNLSERRRVRYLPYSHPLFKGEYLRKGVKNHRFLPLVYRSSKAFLMVLLASSRWETSLKVSGVMTPLRPSSSRVYRVGIKWL